VLYRRAPHRWPAGGENLRDLGGSECPDLKISSLYFIRLGKIPLVIGMPVMISQNFDVPGGVVNGCYGSLRSVRYRVDRDGNRHAISCIVEAPDTSAGIVPGLPDTDCYTKDTVTVKRTQLPLLPAFAMTAHKAQGKTLTHTVINLQNCSGTESPYVMISRVTSLDGLLILMGFSR
jgi:ATP-dependent exoDNAse (exonuclease V) alpha subunit